MRIEEDRGKSGVAAGPFEEDQRLALCEFQDLGFKGKGIGHGDYEIGGFVVVGFGMGRVDFQVLLESRYD